MEYECDIAVVGMGIVGLAHAYFAAKAGEKVILMDGDQRPVGASARNFGFVTISGQASGEMWRFARRTREVWAELVDKAGIRVHQNGVHIIAQRPEAARVLEAFHNSYMGEETQIISSKNFLNNFEAPFKKNICSVLFSPHEMRINPIEALSQLLQYLEQEMGVKVLRQFPVQSVDSGLCESIKGKVKSSFVYLCTGDSNSHFFKNQIDFTRCKLQMLKIGSNGFKFPSTIMTDLSLARYTGFRSLPEADDLEKRLKLECQNQLDHGIHLIVAQNMDGSLVIGDSHEYSHRPDPFQSEMIDRLILRELKDLVDIGEINVLDRWIGTYAHSKQKDWGTEEVAHNVFHSVITSGAGMSTSLAIAEKNIQKALNL